jgi:hypothetical protein
VEKVIHSHTWVKVKNTLIENDSSKNESHQVKYYLSKSLKVFCFKYTYISKVNVVPKIYLSNTSKSTNNLNSLY